MKTFSFKNQFSGLLILALLASCAKELPREKLPSASKVDDIKVESFTQKSDEHVMLKDAEGKDLSNVWLYKVTVVKNSGNGGFAFVGWQSDAKAGYFKFDKDKLKFLSAKELQMGASTSERILNQWNVDYVDYKLAESGGKVQNREEEDKTKLWNKKRYFRMKFDQASVSEINEFSSELPSCYIPVATHVVKDSIQNDSDYKSWVMNIDYKIDANCKWYSLQRIMDNDLTYNVQYRYSFKKLDKNIGFPKTRYRGENDPLDKHFGFFKTINPYVNKKNNRREHEILMNKWDPRKEHNYYFTKNFPQKYKELFLDIFAKTNKLFEKNGLPIRFHARENTYGDGKAKELGDLRYSFINVVEEQDSQAPLGYGPSDTNPFTGEIISGNIHVWTYMFKYYVELIAEEQKVNEKLYDSSLFTKMKDFLGSTEPADWKRNLTNDKSKKLTTRNVFQDMLREKTFAYPYWNSFTFKTNENQLSQEKLIEKHLSKSSGIRFYDELFSSHKLQAMSAEVKRNHEHSHNEDIQNIKGHCKISVEEALEGVESMIIDGKSAEEIIYTSIYTTSIHELGHTLNLRHNFYGSIDHENIKTVTETTADGTVKTYPGKTSSVMDYMGLMDEVHANHEWGPYDEAALLYAYSNGNIVNDKKFMFCTDEHKILNSMCNTWDNGTTPTQVVMNMIESYERSFSRRNFRFNRAFWDTSYYSSSVFRTMYDVKKFLLFWRSVFADHHIDKFLADKAGSDELKTEIKREIRTEFHEAIKLSLAFYNAVLQQSSAERPWRTVYSNRAGAVEQLGIIDDKIYAAMFMLGDDSFQYDPNMNMSYASYLSYMDETPLRNYINKAMENNVVNRIDMDIWFSGFVKNMYASNAANFINETDKGLLDKIKIRAYPAHIFHANFQFDVESKDRVIKDIKVTSSIDPDFQVGDVVGYAYFEGTYYLVKRDEADYAYAALRDLSSNIYEDNSAGNLVDELKDFVELYRIYNWNND